MKPIKWRAKVEHLVACNCNWGCPCVFDAPPTPGYCEGAVAYRVVTGKYGDVTLDGLKWALVIRWPGAIHERNGRGVLFLDARARGPKREALEAIASGRAGGPIGIFMSTVDAGLEVREARVEFKFRGANSAFQVPDAVEVAFEPILNPVTKLPHYPSVDLPTGLLTDHEDFFSNKVATVNIASFTMNLGGKNASTQIGNWKGP